MCIEGYSRLNLCPVSRGFHKKILYLSLSAEKAGCNLGTTAAEKGKYCLLKHSSTQHPNSLRVYKFPELLGNAKRQLLQVCVCAYVHSNT